MSSISNSPKIGEVTDHVDPADPAVDTAGTDGGTTEATPEARDLLDEKPDRQTSFDEKMEEMIRWGKARVGVESGQ
jgi:hypothetical protein